jgi:hypothetical protein
VCGGYAWSVNRAWNTSATPGTAGRHARTRDPPMQGTYKTAPPGPGDRV